MPLSQDELDLIESAKNGNLNQILNLVLSRKININAVDSTYKRTPLMWAIIFQQIPVALLLLKLEVNIIIRSYSNKTALHYAAEYGLLEVCKTLVFLSIHNYLKPDYLNYLDNHNNTCLHIAAKKNHETMVKWLVSAGADKTLKNKDEKVAAEVAKDHNHLDVEEYLLNPANQKNLRLNKRHQSAIAKRVPIGILSQPELLIERDLFECVPVDYVSWYGQLYWGKFIVENASLDRKLAAVFDLNALGLACYQGHFSLFEKMWPKTASFNKGFTDIHGMNIFLIALTQILRKRLDKKSVDSYEEIRNFLLVEAPDFLELSLPWIIEHGNLRLFQEIIMLAIWNSIAIADAIFEQELPEDMRSFLDYRSARRGNTVRQRLQALSQLPIATKQQEKEKLDAQNKLKQVYYDYLDTSDEDASDDEHDVPQMVIPENQGNLANPEFKLLTRGTHFCPNRFDTHDSRRKTRLVNYHKHTVYSQATYNLADREKIEDEEKIGYKEADELVNNYFKLLKLTPDKAEKYRGHEHVSRGDFSSLYLRLIHVYVNKHGYDALFNKKEILYNFNFLSADNPTLSTTPEFLVAYKYCSGDRIVANERMYPKLWRAYGILKHRRLGYVQVYLIDSAYMNKHSADIDKLKTDGKIRISHNYAFNQEVIIESSIPEEYVFACHVFSLPNFDGAWTPEIRQNYGLSQSLYNSYKTRLLNFIESSEEIRKFLIEIISQVTAYQANQFREKIVEWRAAAISANAPLP